MGSHVPDEPVLLQEGPERFRVLRGDGSSATVSLPHVQRRGLGLHGVPPLRVAEEIVRFLGEREVDLEDGMVLGTVAGRYPEFVEELRHRLG